MYKKGRVDYAIKKSCHCTCAVTKMSPCVVMLLSLWITDAEVDGARCLLANGEPALSNMSCNSCV